jgi:hypothetical protein
MCVEVHVQRARAKTLFADRIPVTSLQPNDAPSREIQITLDVNDRSTTMPQTVSMTIPRRIQHPYHGFRRQVERCRWHGSTPRSLIIRAHGWIRGVRISASFVKQLL